MRVNIDDRIKRLEWSNGILLIIVLGIAISFVLANSAQDDDTLQARRFELVDAAGNVQAVLGADADGSAGLFILDPNGGVRLSLTHDSSQSALYINDEEGTIRIGVAQFAHGGGGVALHGAQSKGATVLYHMGSGSLKFYDSDGKVTSGVSAE